MKSEGGMEMGKNNWSTYDAIRGFCLFSDVF